MDGCWGTSGVILTLARSGYLFMAGSGHPRRTASGRIAPLRRSTLDLFFTQKEIVMESANAAVDRRVPWNKGKLIGQKPPLKLREIWAIRMRLQMASNTQELAMFNLAIDSKWPCPISPDTSDGMMMPGEKDDDTQQKNIH